MSANIHQVYIANPATAMQANDLFYLGRSPYGVGNDMGILWSNVLASIAASLPGGVAWSLATGTVAMVKNNGYITNDPGTIVTFHLPTSAAVGDEVQITGYELAGWTLALILGQVIHMGTGSVTPSTGTLSSTNHHDCVLLRCAVANTEWVVESSQGNLATT